MSAIYARPEQRPARKRDGVGTLRFGMSNLSGSHGHRTAAPRSRKERPSRNKNLGMTGDFAELFGSVAASLRTNAPIKIINTLVPLHLENFPATLEFLAAMSNGSQTRSLFPNSHEIPVGIIISILVIVPGPA